LRAACPPCASLAVSALHPRAPRPPLASPQANPGRPIDVFVIVLEFASGGDVMSRIEEYLTRKAHFSEKVAAKMFKQMLLAVQHCHKQVRAAAAAPPPSPQRACARAPCPLLAAHARAAHTRRTASTAT
jgi:hypothetical protein